MTCFWDHILQSLNQEDLKILNTQKNNISLIQSLKEKNILCENVLWQGTLMHKKLLEENFDAIKEYNKDNINSGHDCSTCDPFLCLISELLKIDIDHLYQNSLIQYRIVESRRLLKFKSDTGHFYI